MEALLTSEMSVYFIEATWRYIPEGYHLQTHCCVISQHLSFLADSALLSIYGQVTCSGLLYESA
jgi:hypothetical protein